MTDEIIMHWSDEDWYDFLRKSKKNLYDHFWLETSNKIIDITADQFHPSERDK